MSRPAVTITEITEENYDALMERLTGFSRWQISRCWWDPEHNQGAEPLGSGCQNEATVELGSRGEWSLCETCAALPRFKRFRTRYPLPSLYGQEG